MSNVQKIDNPGYQMKNRDMAHLLELSKEKLSKVSTAYLSEERLCALAVSMWNKDDRLRRCDPTSFLLAIYKACQFGLDPTGIGNQGHIVAYKGKAEFVRGWGGVITMAARRGITIDTFAVYDGDEFEVARYVNADGYHIGLHHKECRDDPEKIGDVRAAYAVATCREWDQPMIEIAWRHDIEKIRKNSAAPNSPAWKSWYSEMARKTAVNRLSKRLPLFIPIKEISLDGGRITKTTVPIAGIANEDTFYQGKVGNAVIDATIDGDVKQDPPEDAEKLSLISTAIGLRDEYPDIYGQVFGRKDVTKMDTKQLSEMVDKVQVIGNHAQASSTAELVQHTNQEDELGF